MKATERHERASRIFLSLRDLPPDERRAALDETVAGDGELRAEIESLLAHDFDVSDGERDAEAADGEREAGSRFRLAEREGLAERDGVAERGEIAAREESETPERVGPYRVLGRLGRGGSGLVFLAESPGSVRKRVAIKVVPLAALHPALAARFEVERRVLESMTHPNIPAILDAGRTEEGLPYLVLELVDGKPITTACASARLPLRQRVELLIEVARAVQHAHQHGVIHRDLKPANVLASEVDGRLRPHVLDFGIAKAIAGRLRDESPRTQGMPLGTPSYMAPEQTGRGEVDARTDVYALGALLYELVCEKPPIDDADDALEMLDRIRSEVPRRASERGRAREICSETPRSMLHDLDAILARALEKDPDRRYATVASFADDLVRLLEGEAVEARAPTLGYRLARFARRHRAVATAGAVAIVAVLVGLIGLSVGLLRAMEAREAAELRNELLDATNRFLHEDILAAASPEDAGREVRAYDLLTRASARVDERFADRPAIAASLHHTLGEAYASLGAFDEAASHLERAVSLWRACCGEESTDLLHSEIAAASLAVRRERVEEGARALEPLIARARTRLGRQSAALYTALNDFGVALATLDRPQDAARVLEEALAGRRRLLPPNHNDVIESLSNLAILQDRLGDAPRGLELLREAMTLVESQREPSRLVLLSLANNIGATYQDLSRDREAAPYLRRSAELAEEVLGADHPSTLTILGNLAGLEAELGDPEKARDLYRRVVERRLAIFGAEAETTIAAEHGYWTAVAKTKAFAEAITGFAELLARSERALGAEHWLALQTCASLARAHLDHGEIETALGLARRAESTFRTRFGEDHARTRSAKATAEEAAARLASETPDPRP